MVQIPDRFPTRTADRALAGMLGPMTCIIQLEMGFEHELDAKRFEKALFLLTERLPILGCAFVPGQFRPCFKRLDLQKHRIFSMTEESKTVQDFKNAPMDFFNGPQMGTCLFRSENRDRVLLKVSHLVCDAAGVKDIAGELSAIYKQLKDNPDFIPKPDLEDHRGFWQIVRQIPWYALPRIMANYICEIYGSKIPSHSHRLPVQPVTEGNIKLMTQDIGKARVSRLMEYGKKRGATLNDILITAIIRAISETGEHKPDHALRLGMAVDMRRYLPGNKADSIANFSALELFNFGRTIEPDFEATLDRVVQKTGRRKTSWLGLSAFISTYPLLWSLPFFMLKLAGARGWEIKTRSPNAFDWLTNMGVLRGETLDFDGEPSFARLLVPGCALPMLFFGCSSYKGGLTFSWSVGADGTNEEITTAFFDALLSHLPV